PTGEGKPQAVQKEELAYDLDRTAWASLRLHNPPSDAVFCFVQHNPQNHLTRENRRRRRHRAR
uniref:Uncharacterized protein n=1 Tax=Aegilops tauschii subsp. strangulata TaxID=200361 RepID=A0A452YRH1_AEGTS